MTKAAGGLVDVADLGTDTGWISVVLDAAWTVPGGYTMEYRKLNGVVYVQGRISRASGTTTSVTATGSEFPVGFRPSIPILDLQIAANISKTSLARVYITSSGVLNCDPTGTSPVGINASFIPAPA